MGMEQGVLSVLTGPQAYLFTIARSNIGSHWLSYCLLALPTLIIPGTLLI